MPPSHAAPAPTNTAPYRNLGLSAYSNAHRHHAPYMPLKETDDMTPTPTIRQQQQKPGGIAASPFGALAAANSADRRGPRLFDPLPGDPSDERSFFASLGHELKGLKDEEAIAARQAELARACRSVLLLAGAQVTCALVMLGSQALEPQGARDAVMIITSLVVLGAGALGIYGATHRTTWPLHAFFLTQIWVLAAMAAQWMRSESAAARQAVIFEAQRHPPPNYSPFLQNLAFVVALGVVYASMFFTDLLTERLQDNLEAQDEHAILHFAWLMHKKTLVGVQRFEDLIHAKFEELVLLGFLKPRWNKDR